MFFGLATAGFTLVGCSTDDNIDVSDVDTTLGIGTDAGFSIPAGNSDPIEVINLFELDGSDCIDTIPGGEYRFFKDDKNIEATNVKIDPVTVNLSTGNIQSIEFKLPIISSYTAAPSRSQVMKRAKQQRNFTQTITAFNFAESNLTGSIRELKKVEIDDLPFSLTLTFSNDLKGILNSFSGLSLELPSYLDIKNNKIQVRNGGSWQEYSVDANGKILLTNIGTNANLELKGNIVGMDFTTAPSTSIVNSTTYRRELTFASSADYKQDLSKVIFDGFIDVEVDYHDNDLTFDTDNPTDVIAKLGGKTDDDFKIQAAFTIGDDSQKITFRDATGRFYPNIDLTINPVNITDIPDFLTKDGVKIDLDDIYLTLDVVSTLPIVGKVDAHLTPIIKGVKKSQISVNGLTVDKNATSKILISRKNNSSKAGYTDYHWFGDAAGSGDLGNLLTEIPDKIEFDCEASADSNVVSTVYLNKDYTIKPAYEISAPLALRKGSCIVYNDKADEWNKDLNDNDIDLNGDTYLMVEADVVNNTPLDLEIDTPEPIGINESSISEVKVEMQENGKNITTLSIKKGLTTKMHLKISTTGDGLKKLDGIKYAVRAKGADDGTTEALNGRKHTIQLNNIVGTLKGKATYNPDK